MNVSATYAGSVLRPSSRLQAHAPDPTDKPKRYSNAKYVYKPSPGLGPLRTALNLHSPHAAARGFDFPSTISLPLANSLSSQEPHITQSRCKKSEAAEPHGCARSRGAFTAPATAEYPAATTDAEAGECTSWAAADLRALARCGDGAAEPGGLAVEGSAEGGLRDGLDGEEFVGHRTFVVVVLCSTSACVSL